MHVHIEFEECVFICTYCPHNADHEVECLNFVVFQTFFNEIIFDGEIKLYASEGIPCEGITFQVHTGPCVGSCKPFYAYLLILGQHGVCETYRPAWWRHLRLPR